MRLAILLAALLACLGAGHEEGPYEPLVVVSPTPQTVLANEARALIADINRTRQAHGLAPVDVDSSLSELALDFARDMAARRFFGHVTPDGSSLPDRLARTGIHWTVAAENIALDRDEPHANEALLESPPHRANILDPRVSRIGVAALEVGVGASLYVEEFAR